MAEQTTELSVDDIKSLSKKLDDFGKSLPAGEREVLGFLIARADESGGDDVKGYSMPGLDMGGMASPMEMGLGVMSPKMQPMATGAMAGRITISGSWSW